MLTQNLGKTLIHQSFLIFSYVVFLNAVGSLFICSSYIACYWSHMIKKLVYAVLLSFALLVPASTPALANGCGSKARAFVADKPRTTLIAVKAQKQRNGSVICVARVRIRIQPHNRLLWSLCILAQIREYYLCANFQNHRLKLRTSAQRSFD